MASPALLFHLLLQVLTKVPVPDNCTGNIHDYVLSLFVCMDLCVEAGVGFSFYVSKCRGLKEGLISVVST